METFPHWTHCFPTMAPNVGPVVALAGRRWAGRSGSIVGGILAISSEPLRRIVNDAALHPKCGSSASLMLRNTTREVGGRPGGITSVVVNPWTKRKMRVRATRRRDVTTEVGGRPGGIMSDIVNPWTRRGTRVGRAHWRTSIREVGVRPGGVANVIASPWTRRRMRARATRRRDVTKEVGGRPGGVANAVVSPWTRRRRRV